MKTIYKNILAQSKNLKPSPQVDKAFTELVEYATNPRNKPKLYGGQYTKLRNISSLAEYELEKENSVLIASSRNPSSALKDFVYYKNYEDLVTLEYINVSLIKKINKALFIGGGPLPLTAIILSHKYGIRCDVLENNLEAVTLAEALISSLGLSSKVTVIHTNAKDFTLYGAYDCIYLAAMVEQMSPAKIALIHGIFTSMSKDSLLLCRSAHLNRKLLYVHVATKNLPVAPILEVRPYNHIINSFLVLQR